MKPKLHIEIKGGPNTGKSTVAYQLAKFLAAHNICVTIHDKDKPPETADLGLALRNKLAALSNRGLQVDINVTQVQRQYIERPGCGAAPGPRPKIG